MTHMRRGMGVGSGKRGYYNLVHRDRWVHAMSAKGIRTLCNIRPIKTRRALDMSHNAKIKENRKTNADFTKDVYDSQGNILEETYADGTKNVYKRDRQGNLIEKTYADGTKDVYKRDKQGHLLEATYPDGTKYVYDKQGHLLEATYPDGTKYVYDKQGNVLET